jgi:hypothetical protein
MGVPRRNSPFLSLLLAKSIGTPRKNPPFAKLLPPLGFHLATMFLNTLVSKIVLLTHSFYPLETSLCFPCSEHLRLAPLHLLYPSHVAQLSIYNCPTYTFDQHYALSTLILYGCFHLLPYYPCIYALNKGSLDSTSLCLPPIPWCRFPSIT